MIHLGYLGYDQNRKTAFVPNEEIRQELTLAVESKHWNEMLLFQQESEKLLGTTLVTLLAILFFGGETIRGFIFALVLGVVVGTLSTLFVATPIAYGLMKREGLGKK